MTDLLSTILGGVGAGLTYAAGAGAGKNPSGSSQPAGAGIPVKHSLDLQSLMPIGILAIVLFMFMKKR